MEVHQRFIEPFDIGDWQRIVRPELFDYSGLLTIHPRLGSPYIPMLNIH